MIDQYRIQLFKNKLRSLVEVRIRGVRFSKSINGEFLFFETNRYVDPNYVADVFTKQLSKENIQFEIRRDIFGLYRDAPIEDQKVWDIKIPIDQEALPERKRKMGSKKRAKPLRMQYLRNKNTFSNMGVIFNVEQFGESKMIRMGHWPHCGMDAKTAKRFGEWLMKRSEEM